MAIKLYNTLTREKEEFVPIKKGVVGMYNCGPTVYNFAHIGNLRSYVFADILCAVFKYNDYKVSQIINITDVGHLTSDSDEGDDKLELGAKREGKTAQEIADFYTNAFFADLVKLNINPTKIQFPKATEHIEEQIELIKKLEEKDFTYITTDGVYFDTSRAKNYSQLAGLDTSKLKEGARVKINPEKKNLSDFALWKFPLPGEKRQQEWESPWGVGFPGWHLECSAMSMKYLGEHFDIHTGGIDHIPVHHTNEIAQSESATGSKFVNYWMHTGHIMTNGEKMSKSEGNFYTLDLLIQKEYSPIAYRYWLLTADYKKTINFTWEALLGAQTALNKLYNFYYSLKPKKKGVLQQIFSKKNISTNASVYKKNFKEYLNNDINTPKAITVLWDVVKDDTLPDADKRFLFNDFDKVLGFGFTDFKPNKTPEEIIKLVQLRKEYRKNKDWKKADEMRDKIASLGYSIDDTKTGKTSIQKT